MPAPVDAADAPVADAGLRDAATAPAPELFALPSVNPAWGGHPGVREASPYLTMQFYRDCGRPIPVSGWASSEGTWHVTAFRCEDSVTDRTTPDPWLSDGVLFLWASRGTLVIEVVSRQGAGPSAKEWRAYLDKAITIEPRLLDPDGGAPPAGDEMRVDRKQLEAFLAKLRGLAVRVPGGGCSRVPREYEALGVELDRIVPSPPGELENAMREVADCRMCGGPGHTCADALTAIQRASEWARRHVK